MRREEFMTELASLLQDISAEERIEAMQYYNDYFDDAGEEEEENIVEKLGSPVKVAVEVKAGLHGQDEEAAEYRETGYTDTRFEYRESPVKRGEDYTYESYTERDVEEKKPWTNKPLKIFLIILVVLAAIPILGPIAIGLVSAVIAIIVAIACAVFGIFAALLIGSGALAIAGFVVFISGLFVFVTGVANGFLVTGAGLVLTVLGVIATVASVKLCIVVVPGIIRGIVWLGRKIFRRDKEKVVE